MKPFQIIEIPKALRKRPKDRRGYPVPFVAMIDAKKRPHFTISDHAKVLKVVREKRCGLCGDRLRGDFAFVGGPRCFLDPMGAFLDPAMHHECARYAIQVCPYLAAPSYGRRIDDKTLRPGDAPGMVIHNAEAMPDDRPALFVLGRADDQVLVQSPGGFVMRNPGPWLDLEYWHIGARVKGELRDKLLAADKERWS